jgi:hypothetical protein
MKCLQLHKIHTVATPVKCKLMTQNSCEVTLLRWILSDVSMHRVAFIFRVKQSFLFDSTLEVKEVRTIQTSLIITQ